MKKRNASNFYIFLISTIGVIFSGYLTYQKVVNNVCAIDESCPLILGISACLYGLAFFLILFILSLINWLMASIKTDLIYLRLIFIVAFLGGAFAAYITYLDIQQCPIATCKNKLFLPSCFYGMIMYIIIFILAFNKYKKLVLFIENERK